MVFIVLFRRQRVNGGRQTCFIYGQNRKSSRTAEAARGSEGTGIDQQYRTEFLHERAVSVAKNYAVHLIKAGYEFSFHIIPDPVTVV